MDQNPEALKSLFSWSQWALGFFVIAAAWFLKPKKEDSQFKSFESDRKTTQQRFKKGYDLLAHTKQAAPQKPLQLGGISLQGAPHEVLGISEKATTAEIQRAYKELMKRYHPDRVGPPGSREWNDAQKIAETLNQAKDTLLKFQKK